MDDEDLPDNGRDLREVLPIAQPSRKREVSDANAEMNSSRDPEQRNQRLHSPLLWHGSRPRRLNWRLALECRTCRTRARDEAADDESQHQDGKDQPDQHVFQLRPHPKYNSCPYAPL